MATTYRWEQGINKNNWESQVQEDELGNLITSSSFNNDQERLYKLSKHNRITKSIRRGLIRYLVIALDSSKSSAVISDYKPCRLEVMKKCIEKFILEYFDQNPISQVSLAVTRNRIAQKITDLNGNSKSHIHKLQSLLNMEGLASLQNTIILGISILKHIPNYGHREMLILFTSLSTCDPGDIFTTIQEAIANKVRISIICLVAEVFICKQIAELTKGTFSVALDSHHLSELLLLHTIPPAEIVHRQEPLVTDYIYMGFPKRAFDTYESFSFDGKHMKLSDNAYICPRCSTRSTDIPTQCCVCNLQLNSSSHIARSHHHLFPVPNFIEYKVIQSSMKSPSIDSYEGGSSSIINTNDHHLIYQAIPIDTLINEHHSNDNDSNNNHSPLPHIYLDTKELTRCRGCLQSLVLFATTDLSQEQLLKKDNIINTLPKKYPSQQIPQIDNNNREGNDRSNIPMMILRCPGCCNFFCMECDLFIHDSLHNCPGCHS